ncbi:structural constituent of ribosome [Polyrhizophydium stewartii]|uniref:Structural constituent of ribosome n=1 Tax=Polyrhizophydium stewartii TaxID=2732419 RepID=A0ABR4NGD1_9FUNG|nr:hypothetical protein HK105_001124 [Polyrhizophydium stewartii]
MPRWSAPARRSGAPNAHVDADDGEALPYFKPKQALERLPNVVGIRPRDLELHADRRERHPNRVLMRAVDLEHRVRHDMDGRTQLITRGSPQAIPTGSVVMIEYVNSRSKARKQYFAGVLMEIRRKGIMSSLVLRNFVMGTGVEMLFPLYSPMIQKIRMLQPAAPELAARNKDSITWIREKPCPGVDYTKIEEMVARYRTTEERLERRQQQQQQQQQQQ